MPLIRWRINVNAILGRGKYFDATLFYDYGGGVSYSLLVSHYNSPWLYFTQFPVCERKIKFSFLCKEVIYFSKNLNYIQCNYNNI